jgi:CDP-diacylglycerol pyrophosphatase
LLRIVVASLSIAVVFSALAGVVSALAGFADGRRGALWEVVRTCVVNHTVIGFAFPCLEVNTADGEERGYVVLRRPGTPDIVLAPTKQVVGVEDPGFGPRRRRTILRTLGTPAVFSTNCKAGHWAMRMSRSASIRGSRARKINSISTSGASHSSRDRRSARSRRTSRIVIGRASSGTFIAPTFGRGELARVRYPFRLTEGIPDGDTKLTQIGIVVARTKLADGRDGFIVLAWLDHVAIPSRQLAAEEFVDPRCSH